MAKQYSHDYIEKAFYTWYDNDKPGGRVLVTMLEEENGRRPSVDVVENWKTEFGWVERGDALDAQLSVVMDAQVIDKRIKMFEEHAKVGEMIIQKGREYFEKNPVDDANSAIRAITAGVEIQRISVGQAEAYAKISKMSDDQLIQELKKLSGKAEPKDEFTDAEVAEIPNSDTESNESTE